MEPFNGIFNCKNSQTNLPMTLCSPVTSAPSPDIGRRSGLSRKHYYGSLEAVSIQQFTFRWWYLVIYRFSQA